MRTLDEDPITEIDVRIAEYLALIMRFRRGDELLPSERRMLSSALLRISEGTLASIAARHSRRDASRRGGLAGYTVSTDKVLSTWELNFSLIGKKVEAEKQTAEEVHLSERQVRRIRSGHK